MVITPAAGASPGTFTVFSSLLEGINPVGAASAAIAKQPGHIESRLKAAPTEQSH